MAPKQRNRTPQPQSQRPRPRAPAPLTISTPPVVPIAIPKTMQEEIFHTLFGRPARVMMSLAAVLLAGATILGFFQPLLASGPLPVPSRAEVDKLRADTEENFKGVKAGLDQTLETAKAANVAAQQSIQQSNEFRLDRLLTQKVQLEEQLSRNPGDIQSRVVLSKTIIEIEKMTTTSQSSSRSPALVAPK